MKEAIDIYLHDPLVNVPAHKINIGTPFYGYADYDGQSQDLLDAMYNASLAQTK